MYRVIRSGLLLSCALLLAACSASDFTTPVTRFSEVTGTAATSFKTSRESVEKFANARQFKLLAGGATIRPQTDKDCLPTGSQCRLVIVDKTGRARPVDVSLDNLQKLMDGLDAYTKNLSNIVKADTATDVGKATDAIKNNLSQLAQDTDGFAKQRHLGESGLAHISPFIGPVSDAANFAISKALEAEKIAALRAATAQMEEIFPTLTRVFEEVSKDAMRQQRRQLDAAFQKAWNEFEHNKNEANRDTYLRAAEVYDAALKSDPQKMYESLREGHQVLARALNAPNPSFTELWTLLQKATDEAVKLAEISKALQKAATTAKQT
jgi:hypothetical protein